MFFNINELCWDEEILRSSGDARAFVSARPAPVPSSQVYGYTDPTFLGDAVPIAGAAGDKQAAL